MAWFESGRLETVEYRFTLTARHLGGQAVCEGASYAAGPDFTVRLAAVREAQPGGTSFFLLTISASGGMMSSFYSTPVPNPPANFDYTTSVSVLVTYPARERKEVRIPAPPAGAYDWLPPDVELAYALHPRPGTNFSIVTTSDDPALTQSVSRPSSSMAEDADLAPRLQIGLGVTDPPAPNSGARGFTGLIAEVTSARCNAADLNFNDGGTPSSGFNASTTNGRCFTSRDGATGWGSIRLELTNTAGLDRGSGSDNVWPTMSWGYDGWVRVFAEPYPVDPGVGPPVIHDFPTNADYTATGGHLAQTFANRRRFDWGFTLADTGGTPQTGSQARNEHPSPIKAELQEAWVNTAGEAYNDRRIPLEDDQSWDAMQLSRQPSVVVEPLDSTTGWAWEPGGSGAIAVDGPALKVTPAADDSAVSKTVDHNLGTYRYLKIGIKADAALIPVRITLGPFFWDVLVEAADSFETKTLDLAAPHNATAFGDVEALQAITAISFGNLQSDINYWFTNMRLERSLEDRVHVLVPFEKDGMLFHRCDRRLPARGCFPWR